MRRNWTEKMGIASLKSPDTGEQVGDAVGKATILNKQFQQAFTSETPLSDDHSKPQTHPDIPDITFTVNGIQRLLAGLDSNKASGPDKVLPRVLKELASPLAPILSDLFNRSFQTGSVPKDWRHANVSPVYKKGKNLAVNYRPISLTCVCFKVYEHIVASALMSHAQRHNLLYSLQHGIRSKLSCETQLVEFVRDLAENMYAGHQTDVLVMDFSKAFDKVGHWRLLIKLQGYGATGNMNSWIQNWLADRTQVVVVDGEQSGPVPVTSGVPQGSVLRPCLFLFFINDMAEKLQSTVRLFADDTIAYLAVDNQCDAMALQHDLDLLAEWEQTWQVEFHPDKCQVLRVTNKHPQNITPHDYILHGHTLSVVDDVKYLGLTVSSNLRWDTQIAKATAKANSTMAVLRRNVRVSSKAIKSTAYSALVRPHVEYCSAVWDPYTKKQTQRVEMVQRRAARWVCGKFRQGLNCTGPTEMISHLGWPSLEVRKKVARLTLLYKMANNLVLMSTRSLLIPAPRSTRAMLPHAYMPMFHTPKRLYQCNSFLPRTVTDWNHLPNRIAASLSLEAFKASVMKHLA